MTHEEILSMLGDYVDYLIANLVFCHIISITFVHFDRHSFIVLKKHTKKAGRLLQSVPPGKFLITGCS